MARLPVTSRPVPWLMLLTVARAIWERVRDDLSPADRRRLGRLITTRPDRLTKADLADLRRIVGKIDLRTAGKDLAAARIGRGLRR